MGRIVVMTNRCWRGVRSVVVSRRRWGIVVIRASRGIVVLMRR